MLLPRVLTAAVGIPLFLYVIHLGGWPFLFLCAGLALLALHEYATVLWLGGRGVQRYLVCVLGTALALCVGVSGPAFPAAPGLSSAAVSLVVLAAMLRELIRSEHSLDRAALTILGALFIGWPLGHVALLRQRAPGGEGLVYLLFACVWATDTLAYAAGRAFGRRKLAPALSPKKTWEGALGGLLGALVIAALLRRALLADVLSPHRALAFGLLAGTLGQASDAAQSLVKRASGAKDSGSLLPGHGGVFDRMDSFLLLAPAFYWLAVWWGL